MIRSLALRLMQRILTSRRNAIIEKHLPRGAALIADVGCGHYANKFANVAMDKLDNADVERGGLPLSTERAGVTFHDVDLNVFPYPFTDKQFDYIICTHVLEHLADPVRACQELSRIGKAGYLEVPYFGADVFVRNNDVIHRWLCLASSEPSGLGFVNRDLHIRRFPPMQAVLPIRFLLQLRNIAYCWTDSINAQYLGIETIHLDILRESQFLREPSA